MPANSAKDRLLEAAIICLRREGYAATTARDIAAEAGANLRSIGYHYGSTRGLLLAAISANWRRWLAPLIAATSGDGDLRNAESLPEQRLAQGMARFATALAENASIAHAWLEAVTLAPRDAELRAKLAANQREFGAALANNLRAAGQPDADARATAIIAVCDGLVVHFLLYGEALRPEDVAREAASALAKTTGRSA